jgi:hypothetical protein
MWLIRTNALRRFFATAAAGAALAVAASAVTPTAAEAAGAPPLGGSFWSPYDDWSSDRISATLSEQAALGQRTLIIDWAAHLDANDTAYPADPALGYTRFNDVIPRLVAQTTRSHFELWMGLAVAPDGFPANEDDPRYLADFVHRSIQLADDLFARYGAAIHGWYIPTEPTAQELSSPAKANQYAGWLTQLVGYLHSHDGGKPVMISPCMPTAIQVGWTADQFVSALAPLMRTTGIDVWNVQDGFEMTGWSPTEEAHAFTQLADLASRSGTHVWADVYTPARDGLGRPVTAAQLYPYLAALKSTGVPLVQWTFNDYFASTTQDADAALRSANTAAYRSMLLRLAVAGRQPFPWVRGLPPLTR